MRPDVVIILTDEERAAPPYEGDDLRRWRHDTLTGRRWFDEHGVSFGRHYTGSLACVPSRPTLFTGQYPDVHGVTQTDGLGKVADDSRMRWLREGEVPTLGHWFRAGGYDTHYEGKWHISHADLIDSSSGRPLATNDDDGVVDPAAVRAYLDADPLDPFGFSGWVGPEPHGAGLANSGTRRDPIIAARVVAWLQDRYARRRAGDPEALRPFLLVASFVNPHDIVLFPAWARRGNPIQPSPLDPPPVAAAPTDDEDLRTKPAVQVAFRAAYPTGYGPAPAISRIYERGAQRYRDLYHRLHAEVDGPLDLVRRAVTEDGSTDALLVRTSDHGELLGAHGGLHQKWCNLYDEATRVPFTVVRIGDRPTTAATVDEMPTSHVDLVPTLLAAAGSTRTPSPTSCAARSPRCTRSRAVICSPWWRTRRRPTGSGRSTSRPATTCSRATPGRRAWLAASAAPSTRRCRSASRCRPTSARASRASSTRVGDHLWKLVRTFDDPATWTEPGVRHRAADGPAGVQFRTLPLPDQWELYDLSEDPIEVRNRAHDGSAPEVLDQLRRDLDEQRRSAVPERHQPWPYVARRGEGPMKRPPAPARLVRKVVQRLGMHPEDPQPVAFELPGRRALVVATNHGTLDIGKPTGVFASELTVPYYAFLDAGMDVDVASPLGGVIPVDPLSLKPVVRTEADDRFLADDDLRLKVTASLAVGSVDIGAYDLVYLAGGWGAAFDFGFSEPLAAAITEANAAGKVIGGICHGPLGLRNATEAGRSPVGRGPAHQRGHRRAGAAARHRVDAAPPGDGAAGQGGAVRVGHRVPRTCSPTTGWSTATS